MKNIYFLIIVFCQLSLVAQEMQVKSSNGDLSTIETILQQYIQLPSVSGSEKLAGDYLKTICRKNGLHITDFGNIDGQYNFAASVFPLDQGRPNIIFLNHIDVVPESQSENRAPYSGEIDNGIIYGRGAIDNKGAAMMQLYGMLQFMEANPQKEYDYNITLLSVSCEESQCDGGIQYVIDNHFEDLNPAVVLGEGPTELSNLIEGDFNTPVFGISVIHKRPLWIELELKSKTQGHGSITPKNYANKELVLALERLTSKKPKVIYNDVNIKFLRNLSPFYNGSKKMALKNPKLFRPFLTKYLRDYPELFSLFTNTITLTNFYTDSEAVNKLSSVAWAQLDCRLLPETNEQEFIYEIKKRLDNEDIKVKVIKKLPPNKASDTETIYFKNLSAAIMEYYPGSGTMDLIMPNVNDLGVFRAKGIPCYGALPVVCDLKEVRSIHGKDEHLRVESLYDGAAVYRLFLMKMMSEQ